MNIFELETNTLKPYDKNAKLHDQKQIDNVAESIKTLGFRQPIVVDKDRVIIIGHCRFLASKKLGLEKVPCVIADDLNEEQVKKLRLLDNKTNESDWDYDFLALDLEGLDFDGFDIDWGIPTLDDENYDDEEETDESLVEKKLLRCPCCGHINEEKAFKTYNGDLDEDSK